MIFDVDFYFQSISPADELFRYSVVYFKVFLLFVVPHVL